MAKQEVSAVQIQMAAAAGVKLLQQDDLLVPLAVAKSGALSVLEGMLDALAKGEVVLANPEPVENITAGPGAPPIAPVETPPGANGDGAEETPEE